MCALGLVQEHPIYVVYHFSGRSGATCCIQDVRLPPFLKKENRRKKGVYYPERKRGTTNPK